jgi:hypothetical protein
MDRSFLVPGHSDTSAVETGKFNGNEDGKPSPSSLPLRPAGPDVLTRPAQTPSNDDHLEPVEIPDASSPQPSDVVSEDRGGSGSEYNDALEEAIEKMRDLKDLVYPTITFQIQRIYY